MWLHAWSKKFIAKGKITMKRSEIVDTHQQLAVVLELIESHCSNIELAVDIPHANNMLFLLLLSKHIYCRTASAVDNMKCTTLEF